MIKADNQKAGEKPQAKEPVPEGEVRRPKLVKKKDRLAAMEAENKPAFERRADNDGDILFLDVN